VAPDAAPARSKAAPGDYDEDELGAIAPPVVAVVVAHEPGPWFEECLASIAAQDYPNLSTLVIDAATSSSDVTARVARVQPSAYVRRLDEAAGFAAAANEVLAIVEGAAFYAFCHDDVALAPPAIRAMVEEAYRSNAGIVTPKVVEWDEPARLLSVGDSADKTGVRVPLIEPGELDQEQHDAVRDVFCAPGGCMLVRADLFAVLDGFDAGIDLLGEDLDLSWRAQVAGARVIAAPSAVVRHVVASVLHRPTPDRTQRIERHRIRTMLSCYGRLHRWRVVPQALALSALSAMVALLSGHRAHAADIVGGWRWNFARRREIAANRRRLEAVRQLPDTEVRRLQVRGSAQLARLLRPPVGGDDEMLSPVASAGRELFGSLREGPVRDTVLVFAALTLVLVVGSRQLLSGDLAPFGSFVRFPDRPWTLFSEWFSGWRSAGLGSESPAPTGFAILGIAGIVVLGAMSALRRLLVVALLPVGVVGAWRLARGTESTPARLVVTVTYLAIPLPYDAIARGRWGGLLVWAAAPWIVRLLASCVGSTPFDDRRLPARHAVAGLGLAVALLAAFVPFTVVVVAVAAVGLALGGIVAGEPRGSGRVVVIAAGAIVVAAVLQLPWTADFLLPGSQWSAFGGVQSSARVDIGALLRFHTGPVGGGPLGWAFLVVAALPLLIGREWRFTWAARAWALALSCWALAWAGQQSWFGQGTGPIEALLAPAAVALSLSAGLGLLAFQADLREFRFGWRQVVSTIAAAALVAGMLPTLYASFDGRWHAPRSGFDGVLAFLHDEQASAGPFRVVWLGDPDVLPLAGWRLEDGVAYATSDDGFPSVEEQWAGSSDGATSLVGDALHLAQRRDTTRLGRLLAPMGVRYIVVQTAAAPEREPSRPVPAELERELGQQLDLQRVLADPHVQVFRNVAWAPVRTALSPKAAPAARGGPFFDVVAGTDLTGSPPVLAGDAGRTTARGPLADNTTVYVANASSPHWQLTVDGRAAPRTKAFGWANSFAVDRGGNATLRFDTPIQRYGLLAVQVLLWVAALVTWWRDHKRPVRRRRHRVAYGAPA